MGFDLFRSPPSRPLISFEVFPPKSDKGMAALHALLPRLTALRPSFMTVTYGAMGTTRERTLEIATLIEREHALRAACHLTCVGGSRDEITRIVEEIHAAGIRNIVALRGDPPQGETEFVPPTDGFRYGNELVAHLRAMERERSWERLGIAVAGYPEKHLEARSMEADLANLKRKADAGADVIVTQLFYDNADFFRFEKAARAIGIEQPIVPGLLPIVSANQITRIASMCGSKIPTALARRLEEAGDDNERAETIGVEQAIAQARELLDRGVPGIHFYVLNRASHMERIMEAVGSEAFPKNS